MSQLTVLFRGVRRAWIFKDNLFISIRAVWRETKQLNNK